MRRCHPVEQLLREARRRAEAVGAFREDHFVVMLIATRLRHVSQDSCLSSVRTVTGIQVLNLLVAQSANDVINGSAIWKNELTIQFIT